MADYRDPHTQVLGRIIGECQHEFFGGMLTVSVKVLPGTNPFVAPEITDPAAIVQLRISGPVGSTPFQVCREIGHTVADTIYRADLEARIINLEQSHLQEKAKKNLAMFKRTVRGSIASQLASQIVAWVWPGDTDQTGGPLR